MGSKDEILYSFKAEGDLDKKVDDINKSMRLLNKTTLRTIRNLERLEDLTRGATRVVSQYNRAERRLNRSLVQVERSERALNRTQQQLTRVTEASTRATNRQEAGFRRGQNAMMAFKGIAAATAVVLAVSLAKSAVSVASEFETLETKFEPLLGSVEAAKDRIKELADFASKTPFQLKGISQASITLQTLTDGALATGKGLELVGDAAAQAGQPIELLAVHVGRAYSALRANRAIGESLIRFQELGLLSGEARNQIEALQKAGEGKKAFEILRGELEKTSGGMEKLSNTLAGKISTIGDNFQILANNLLTSTGAFDLIKSSADGFLSVLDSINRTVEQFDSGALLEALDPVQGLLLPIIGKGAGARFDEAREQINGLTTEVITASNEADKAREKFLGFSAQLDAGDFGKKGTLEFSLMSAKLSGLKSEADKAQGSIINMGSALDRLKSATKVDKDLFLSNVKSQLSSSQFQEVSDILDKGVGIKQRTDAANKEKGRLETERILREKAEREAALKLAKIRKEQAGVILNNLSESLLSERKLLEKHQNAKFDLLAGTGATSDELKMAEEAFKKESTALNEKLNKDNLARQEARQKREEAERLEIEKRAMQIMDADKTDIQRLTDKYAMEQELFKGNAEVLGALQRKFEEESQAIKDDNFKKDMQRISIITGATASMFGGFAALTKSLQKDREKDSQAFKNLATTEAIINTGLGATQILSDNTIPGLAKIPAALAIVAAGTAQVINIQKARNGLDSGLINGRNTMIGNVLTNDGGAGQEARVKGGILASEATNRFGPGQIAAENNRNTSVRTVTQSINFNPNITVSGDGQAGSVVDALRGEMSAFGDLMRDSVEQGFQD